MLPKQSVNEYLRNGKEATADDDPWRKVGFDESGNPLPPDQIGTAVKVLYQRRLRDYAAELDELARRRISMVAEIDAVKKDIEQLTAAEVIAKKLEAFRTDERQKLTSDLAGIQKERQAIEQHLAQVEQLLAKARQLTTDAMTHNRQLAAELAARQLRPRPAGNGAGSPAKSPEPLALDRAK
jgi:chromosome segregation ATPase